MKQKIHITEEDLKNIIKETITKELKKQKFILSEEGHYPEFLNSFKNEIVQKIENKLSEGFPKSFFINVGKNEYVRYLKIIPEYEKVDDINNYEYYEAGYKSTKVKYVFGKLFVGIIRLVIPYNEKNETNFTLIKKRIIHELNHLYDDWMKRTNQKKRGEKPTPLTSDDKIKEAYNLLNIQEFQELGDFLYRLLKTESQAFLATVPHDLESLHACNTNIHSKSRQIECYKNIWESFNNALILINNVTDDYLMNFNYTVSQSFRKTGLPYIEQSKFNANLYRSLLKEWCKKQYANFLKKYDRVVQYYLDHIPKDVNEPFYHVPVMNRKDSNIIKLMEEYDKSLGLNLKTI